MLSVRPSIHQPPIHPPVRLSIHPSVRPRAASPRISQQGALGGGFAGRRVCGLRITCSSGGAGSSALPPPPAVNRIPLPLCQALPLRRPSRSEPCRAEPRQPAAGGRAPAPRSQPGPGWGCRLRHPRTCPSPVGRPAFGRLLLLLLTGSHRRRPAERQSGGAMAEGGEGEDEIQFLRTVSAAPASPSSALGRGATPGLCPGGAPGPG